MFAEESAAHELRTVDTTIGEPAPLFDERRMRRWKVQVKASTTTEPRTRGGGVSPNTARRVAEHQSHQRPGVAAHALTALDAIFTRRSVRAFAPDRIDAGTVRALLEAAVQAPTALHEEPWVCAVIQDRRLLKKYSDVAKGTWSAHAAEYRTMHPVPADAARDTFAARFASEDFSIFYDAGTLILICARRVGPFAAADCWLAAENLMLAASALGVGTCCIGSALPALNLAASKADLGIPADVDVVVPIIVGIPREPPPAAGRREPVVISWKEDAE